MRRDYSLEKTLMLGKIEDRRRRGRQRMRWLDGIQWTWVCASSGRWWRTGKCGVLRSLGLQNHTQPSNNSNVTSLHLVNANITFSQPSLLNMKRCLCGSFLKEFRRQAENTHQCIPFFFFFKLNEQLFDNVLHIPWIYFAFVNYKLSIHVS